MKFGKEFKRQMVPEWVEAYMDYQGLKRILRKILHNKPSKQQSSALSSLKQFSSQKSFSEVNMHNSTTRELDIEEQTIEVNTVEKNGSRKIYKTDFLKESEKGGEMEVMFFKKLDEELNKVNNFFKDKVKEVVEEVTELNKQMNALVALRIKMKTPDSSSNDAKAPSKPANASTRSNLGRRIEESNCRVDKGTDDDFENPSSSSELDEELEHTECSTTFQQEESDDEGDGLKILERVTLNNKLESPLSTIKCVLNSKGKELRFNKDEPRRVERRLRQVLIAFYQKLCLLKHYSYMNLAAFSKIMKKYDKFSSRIASRSYMRVVDSSCIGNPDECLRRFCKDRDPMDGYNSLKYFSTIIAIFLRTAFELRKGKKWMALAFISSAFATTMSTYWDIVVDWGALAKEIKEPLSERQTSCFTQNCVFCSHGPECSTETRMAASAGIQPTEPSENGIIFHC